MNPSTIRSRRRRAKLTRQQRTKEHSAGAVKRRIALIIVLAPDLRCAECGRQVEDPQALTVDHVDGKAWNPRRLSSARRAARYWREFHAGVAMRALCGLCNSIDGGYKRHGIVWATADDAVPF